MKFRPHELRGLLLTVLEGKDLHGAEIAEAINARTGNALQGREAAIYPLLHRLVQDGVLGVSSNETFLNGTKVELRTYRLVSD